MHYDERIPPEYADILALRGNNAIGGIPPTSEMLDFFAQIPSAHSLLEFGFLYGMSTAIQLTVHPNAKLTAYDPTIWDLDVGPNTFSSPVSAPELATLVFPHRFTFVHACSSTAKTLEVPNLHDAVFIDGLHTTEHALLDIQTAISLEIPYLFIDNTLRPSVKSALSTLPKPISTLVYDEYNPITNSHSQDRIDLYAL